MFNISELCHYYKQFGVRMTNIGDQAIEHAFEDLVKRLNTPSRPGEYWHSAIIQKDHGMLLIGGTELVTPTHVVHYATPTCGEDPVENANAQGTSQILALLKINPAFIAYSRLHLSKLHTKTPNCEPV